MKITPLARNFAQMLSNGMARIGSVLIVVNTPRGRSGKRSKNHKEACGADGSTTGESSESDEGRV